MSCSLRSKLVGRYSSRCDRSARLTLNNNQGMASEHPSAPVVPRRDRIALYAVNFFMADMEAGMGPFLGVLLQSRGWSTGAIGGVITLGAVVGMLTVTPAGALVDATTHKRACVIVVGLGAVAAAAVILMSGNFWVIAGAQAVMCISGATIAPALIGITLGLVGQARFNSQNGRNQAYNHAGNLTEAAIAVLLGWHFGYAAVFWLAAGFAALTIVAVLAIPAGHINHHLARGDMPTGDQPRVKSVRVLLRSRPLLAVAGAVTLFHMGNAAMLPLYGLAVVATNANPFSTVASTVVIAQAVMVPASLAAMRIAQAHCSTVNCLARPLRKRFARRTVNRRPSLRAPSGRLRTAQSHRLRPVLSRPDWRAMPPSRMRCRILRPPPRRRPRHRQRLYRQTSGSRARAPVVRAHVAIRRLRPGAAASCFLYSGDLSPG